MVYSVCGFRWPSHSTRLNTQGIKERSIEPVIARRRESATTQVVGALGLCFLLLLAGPGRLAAQDSAWRLFPGSADGGWPAPSETASLTRSSPVYRLLPEESRDHEPWLASADLSTDAPLRLAPGPRQPTGTPLTPAADALSVQATELASWTQPCPTHRLLLPDPRECERRMAFADSTGDARRQIEQAEAQLPRWGFLERHRVLFSTLIPIASVGAVTANSLVGYDRHSFQIHEEGWFGRNTTNGGADKAAHLADYFVITNLFEDVYRMLGWSERAATLWSFSLAVATGLGNEVSDGFTGHGFSWEDLTMDVAGAATASLVSLTRTKDLIGIRTSHLPSDTFTHDVYSADLKLSGLARRLGVNIGPLRWLLFSVTYGTKGYRVQPPIERQRQVGFEIGLNFPQILNDLGVKRNTWWGYPLYVITESVRFPYTAIGMRLDLNSGNWHGPNSGNYD
jgi:uncharacterized protein YfiM (DUF2279 family)